MKPYEIWEGDHSVWVSSWNELWDAVKERDRLNEKFNRDFYIKRNNPDGTVSRLKPQC